MTIVVIGSNSFSGATFIDYLLACDYAVVGMSRSAELNPVFLPYKWNNSPTRAFSFFQYDLNNDFDQIRNKILEIRPEYVVNFASQSMVAESWLNPDHWFQTNVVATIKLHDFLRQCDFLAKYVHVSTPEVYGSCQGLVPETAPYNPSTPYAVSRAAADMSLMTFLKRYNFPVVFTRAANVYGPGQQLYRIIPRTILCFLSGKKLQLHGGGHSVRSFIHMRDVADGTFRVMQSAEPGNIFHLSTKRTISIREIVELIASLMNVSFNDHVEIVDERPGKDAAYLLDSEKARTKLSWTDTVSLENGIDEVVGWIRSNFKELSRLPWDYIHKP